MLIILEIDEKEEKNEQFNELCENIWITNLWIDPKNINQSIDSWIDRFHRRSDL